MKKILLVAVGIIALLIADIFIAKSMIPVSEVRSAGSTNFSGLQVLTQNGDTFTLGPTTNSTLTGVQAIVQDGLCSTGTTTLFALSNPFAATSTATLETMSSTATNATTSILSVGTSTTNVGLTLALMSPTLIPAATISTTSQFTISSGVRVGSLGQVDAGVNSYRTIMVGPNDYLSAFATSTPTPTITGGVYSGGLGSSCLYKVRWQI